MRVGSWLRRIVPAWLLPTFVALSFTTLTVSNQSAASTAVEVPLLPYFGDLRTVAVVINGDTALFLLDTGGGGTIVTPELATKAGCTPFGQFTGFRFNGEKVSCPRCSKIEFTVGGVPFACEAGVGDLSAMGMPGIGGILALQSFEGSAITLDLGGNLLIIETSETLKDRKSKMRELKVRPGRQSGGAALDMFVRVEAPVGDLWLEMDSGNLQPILLSPHAINQLGITLPADSMAPVALNFKGLGPVRMNATTRESIYDGLLNSAFFMQHVVTFDLKEMRAWAISRVE